ncbi:MAG TPA: glycoside hydrolase family 97 protein [Lacibacter sp.]|nr:glycoside hydrolase family 97 protein [Lacibacter sp.]HMO88168.1 glycoside hydrolase family 97 protein [Lacibacter sp.]
MTRLFLFISLLAGAILPTAAQPVSFLSPGAQIRLEAGLDAQQQFTFRVYYRGAPVVQPSAIGFELQQPRLSLRQFVVKGVDSSAVDESWEPVWGETNRIRNRYNEVRFQLQRSAAPAIRLDVVFRVFDDGIGFRYEFPEQPELNYFIVADEQTQFNFGTNATAFWIPGDYDTNEYTYTRSRLSAVNAGISHSFTEIGVKTMFHPQGVQTPLLLKTDAGLYINLHEAALLNYPAMQLVVDTARYILQSHLVPDAVGNKAYLQTPAHTPWRTLIISHQATGILNSKLILNLNEPSRIEDPSWIRPQKMVGVWWEMHVGTSSWDYRGSQAGVTGGASLPHGANTNNVKRYIDFAAAHGIQGVLVEGWNTGWEDWYGNWKENVFDFVTPYPDFDLYELHRYAREKGVQLIMHHETSASVTNYERHMDTAYRFMKKFGYDAVKTGYVGRIIPRGEHHDGQWMVNHYNRVAEKTAAYRIMVDMHEPVRPTGLHRTWPNWLTSEAARGNEFNAWSRGNPPEHETILPFTRLMGGPMDYTPGIFRIKMNHYRPGATEQVHTTLAKQLALYVTMYSPLQMAADLIENYEARPDAFQFIKDVAVDWEESHYLLAEPGDYLVVARKEKGKPNWFLGAITDEEARLFTPSLSFLPAGQQFVATLYRDAADAHWEQNPEAYVIEKFLVNAATRLRLQLAPGGGAAISFMPASADHLKRVKKYKTPR